MASVMDKYCFTYINACLKGCNSDLLPNEPFIVGVNTFPLKIYLIKPYRENRTRISVSE